MISLVHSSAFHFIDEDVINDFERYAERHVAVL